MSTSPESPVRSIAERLDESLDDLKREELWRDCVTLDSPPGPWIDIEGKRYLHLCSNNYLDLATHPSVIEAAQAAAAKWGAGAGSARLVTGTSRMIAQLERQLAYFKQTEAALVFSSGYMANLGLIPSLAGPGDWIVCDRLNHASLIDAARLSRAEVRPYPHADVDAAREILEQAPSGANKLIVTDGIFSMDGDLAPLAELNELALEHGAWLIVDDAHGTGILGPEGRGSCAARQVRGEHVAQVITLSKSIGSQGGAVVGSHRLIKLLVNRARPFIFETALGPPAVGAAMVALRIIQHDELRRVQLKRHMRLLRKRLGELGLDLPENPSPILPLHVGGNRQALELSNAIRERGYWITAIRPPSVEPDKSRLRLTVMSNHTTESLNQFVDDVGDLLRPLAGVGN